jgi:hypothetical protein
MRDTSVVGTECVYIIRRRSAAHREPAPTQPPPPDFAQWLKICSVEPLRKVAREEPDASSMMAVVTQDKLD